MKKKTKTWKIGEYAKGGIITIEITGNKIDVICKDWDYSKGSNKGSDQSGAKELSREVVEADKPNAYRTLLDTLCELTTSYYADEIGTWIAGQVKFTSLW